MAKPIHKEFYESLELGDNVLYKGQKMHIIYVNKLSNGLIQFDLEGKDFIYENVPNWCCKDPNKLNAVKPMSFCDRLKALFSFR